MLVGEYSLVMAYPAVTDLAIVYQLMDKFMVACDR